MNIYFINKLYADCAQGNQLDPGVRNNVRYWMRECDISFEELAFTEEELEAMARQISARYINLLVAEFEQRKCCDPDFGSSIRMMMRMTNVTFEELAFTEAELEAKVRDICQKV